jgi:hypothetical protein
LSPSEFFVVVCFEFVVAVVVVVDGAVTVEASVNVTAVVVVVVDAVSSLDEVVAETIDDLISSLFSCRIFCSTGS